MIKSILGGKSKNLFDISKADVVINVNIFNPIPAKWECFYKIPVTPGKTYTVSCDTTANAGAGEQLQLSAQTGDKWNEGTRLLFFLTSQEMVKDWVHIKATFTIPDNITQITFSALSDKFFRNFQIELGSTATEYVPHELTSYKSIMKVRGGHFVTSFDERMPCKTKNLFDKSKADVISREYYFTLNQPAGSNFYVMTVKPGITYTVTYERFIKSSDVGAYNALELSIQTGTHYTDGTQLLIILGSGERGVWVKRSKQFTVPSGINQVTFSGLKDRFLYRNFMVQEGTTATDYVPYGYV